MEQSKMLRVAKIVGTLRDKLKCPICLEIMEDVVELCCCHKFCKDCYCRHKSSQKKVTCPICKTVIKRRATHYRDEYMNNLGKFVSNICENLRVIGNPEVDALLEGRHASLVVYSQLAEHEKDEAPCFSKYKREHLKEKQDDAPCFSKCKREHRKEKQDDDDEIVTFNRTGAKKTYVRKRLEKKPPELKYNILDFDNSANRTFVLQWLNDTKNKFDRLTQTQNILGGSEETNIGSLNFLPSVSQRCPVATRKRLRAKSVENDLKKDVNVPRRFSDCHDLIDNYNIEELNSEEEKVVEKVEENILLNLIEDEFLNKLENEMQKPMLHKSKQKDGKSVQENPKPTPNSSATDWDRITEMNRSLRKNLVPKKLKVTLSSQSSSTRKGQKVGEIVEAFKENNDSVSCCKNDDNVSPAQTKSKFKDDKEVISTPVKDCSKETLRKQDFKQGTSTKMYDLSTLENYIAQNMVLEMQTHKLHSQTVEEQTSNTPEKDAQQCNVNICSPKKHDECDVNEVFLAPTQKLRFSDEGKCKSPEINNATAFEQLTQKWIESCIEGKTENRDNVNKVNGTEIHNQSRINLNNSSETTSELLNLLKKSLKICHNKLNDPFMLQVTFVDMDSYINKMKLLQQNNAANKDFGCISIPKKIDVSVQTISNMSGKETQTFVAKTISKKIQTEGLPNNNAVSSNLVLHGDKGIQTEPNDQALLPSNVNSSENPELEKYDTSKLITQGTKKALEMFMNESDVFSPNTTKNKDIASKTDGGGVNYKSQKEIFASTDNLTFDTQELIKRKSKNNIETEDILLKDKNSSEKLVDSQLICTLKSTDPDEHKRKHHTVDSDSDEEIKPVMKRNRFLNPDLSVEFETNALQEKDTQDSESINYNERLDEILKQYDEERKTNASANAGSSANNRNNENVKTENNLLQECDDIIAQVNKNVQKLSEKHEHILLSDQKKNGVNTSDLKKLTHRNYSENSDIISESENFEPVAKKMKSSKLDTINKNVSGSKNLKDPNDDQEICELLNDSLDDEEFRKIQLPEENLPKIHILANVVVKEPPLKPEKLKNDDDLFSDDDFVESTPQKHIERMYSQNLKLRSFQERVDLLVPNPDVENNCDFDITNISPPPAFQDEPAGTNSSDRDCEESKDRITIIALDSPETSVKPVKTPDHNADPKFSSRRNILLNRKSRNRVEHSTPFSQVETNPETIYLSPVLRTTRNTQDILSISSLVDNAKEQISNQKQSSPGVITVKSSVLINTPKRNIPKLNILTSTPKQKSMWNFIKSACNLEKTIQPLRKPCIACTRLSSNQVKIISQLVDNKLATFSNHFNDEVTHMIVAVDLNNCVKDYTLKSVAAIASGIWVLTFGWIQECLAKNSIVPEEPHEVLDDTGGRGPKTARSLRGKNPLFKDFKFYCSTQFMPTIKQDTEDIIRKLGGKLVDKPVDLLQKDGRFGLIITEGQATEDSEVFQRWLELYKIATVDIEWLSRSIGRYKIISIRPFVWCSDENLDELGYPEYLIETVPFSNESTY